MWLLDNNQSDGDTIALEPVLSDWPAHYTALSMAIPPLYPMFQGFIFQISRGAQTCLFVRASCALFRAHLTLEVTPETAAIYTTQVGSSSLGTNSMLVAPYCARPDQDYHNTPYRTLHAVCSPTFGLVCRLGHDRCSITTTSSSCMALLAALATSLQSLIFCPFYFASCPYLQSSRGLGSLRFTQSMITLDIS